MASINLVTIEHNSPSTFFWIFTIFLKVFFFLQNESNSKFDNFSNEYHFSEQCDCAVEKKRRFNYAICYLDEYPMWECDFNEVNKFMANKCDKSMSLLD